MDKTEQYVGLLIRYKVLSDALLIVLGDFQGGYPPNVAEEVREMTINGVQAKELDREGLDNTVGDNLWVTLGSDWAEIGADLFPEKKLRGSSVKKTRRPQDIEDLRALCFVMRKTITAYQRSYGPEFGKATALQTRIGKFISTRHDRLADNARFLSQRDPVKAAEFQGMVTLLEELHKEFGPRGALGRARQTSPVDIMAPMRRMFRRLVGRSGGKNIKTLALCPVGARPQPSTLSLNVAHATSSESLHEMLAAALNFPGYYGKNWNAFSSCIIDSTESLMPRRLVIKGLNILRERLPADAELLQDSLVKIAREKGHFKVVFEPVDFV